MSTGEQEGWPRRHNLPERIGPYEILGELGGGGMATVYLARTNGAGGFHRLFAVKRIHEHLSSDDTFARMFVNEARIAARIHHPGIVSVFDVGEEEGRLYIAMEYLRGETLSFILNRAWKGGPGMPYHMMAYLIASACDALHLAHELRDDRGEFLGVIHRDLSPRNMMVGYDGFLRVLDFGVAKAENAYPKTRTGTQKGTVAYMAPEQILGKNLDRRLDIFALGIVLWESTVGKRLFAAPNDFATAAKVRQALIPPPTGVREDYPQSLERIVLKALRREPDERYQTARELGDALRMFLASSPQLIASTDISDLIHRLCADRLERRIEMERSGLRKLETEPTDGLDSSGIISLNVPASLPRDPGPVAPSRERTDQMDGQPVEVATTQNFLRDQTLAEPLTHNAEVPTAQAYPSAKLEPVTVHSEAVLKIVDGDGTFKTYHGEPATDHSARSHRSHAPADDETFDDGTDQERRPMFHAEATNISMDEHSLGSVPATSRERVDLGAKEPTEREAASAQAAPEEETLRGTSEPPPPAPNPILAAADAALELFFEGTPQRPSNARAPTPLRVGPPARTDTPLRPVTRAGSDHGLAAWGATAPRPPAPPPPSGVAPAARPASHRPGMSGLQELDAGLLEELSADTVPPIDGALAALASTSQLDGHDPFLDISKPRLELGGAEPHARASSRPHSPAGAKSSSAVIFRAASERPASAPGAEARLMSTDAMEPSRLTPMIEADSSWRWIKALLAVSVLVALAAFGALKGPELMDRYSGAPPPAPAVPKAAEVAPTRVPVVVAPPPDSAEAEVAKGPAPTPEPVPAPAEVELSFVVEPAHAVIFVAGDPVESSVRLARSRESIHVEVSAPGYRSKDLRVVPDQDRRLHFELQKDDQPTEERASPRRKKKGR